MQICIPKALKDRSRHDVQQSLQRSRDANGLVCEKYPPTSPELPEQPDINLAALGQCNSHKQTLQQLWLRSICDAKAFANYMSKVVRTWHASDENNLRCWRCWTKIPRRSHLNASLVSTSSFTLEAASTYRDVIVKLRVKMSLLSRTSV